MKIHVWSRLLLAAMLVLNLSACGGSGGGGSEPGRATTLSGVVEDGPVSKATVYAQRNDGTGKAYGHCVTDAQGRFTLTVEAGVDLNELMLVAHGGKDVTTGPKGLDFKGMDMMAPLAMFKQNTAAVVVSPVTTLVGLAMRQGAAYDAACTAVAETLKVSKAKLGARPSVEGGAFHGKTMMLSLVAVAHQRAAGAESTDNAFGLVRFSPEGKAEVPDGADEALAKALADIEAALTEGVDPGETFVRARLLESIVKILEANSSDSKKEDADFKANARQLIDDILVATGSTPINLESMAAERISRFVLRTAGVSTYDAFMAENFSFLVSWVKESKEVAALATPVAAKYDVKEALFDTELLADDNAKRLDYYFNSDASHLFKAEKLIETVLDDTINDRIMRQVAQGRAQAGFFQEAEDILDTKIFGTEIRAAGYDRIGEIALEYSRLSKGGDVTHGQAVGYMKKAEALYKKKIETAGKAFFDKGDAGNLQSLMVLYRSAGELAKADALSAYTVECINAMADANPTALGRILVALRDNFKDLMEAGERAEAEKLPGLMVSLAEKIPGKPSDTSKPDSIDNFCQRISGLGYAVDAYGALYMAYGGDVYKQGAKDAYRAIKTLREANPYTMDHTWSVVADPVIPVLTAIDDLAEVEALMAATPEDNKADVYTAQATGYALGGNMDEAFKVVDKIAGGFFGATYARVSTLTYNNKYSRWIASRLVDAGPSRYADAVRALKKAEGLLDAFEPAGGLEKRFATTIKLDWGYLRIAELYGKMNNKADQLQLLEKAEKTIREDLAEVSDKIEKMCVIAPYWKQAGDEARMAQCMTDARDLADAAAETGSETPKKLASFYKDLMDGYMALEDRAKIRELANILAEKSVALFDLADEGDQDKALYSMGNTLYYAAGALIGVGQRAEAVVALDKALPAKYANFLDAFSKDKKAQDLCIGTSSFPGLVAMYAHADAIDKAVALSKSFDLPAISKEGLVAIAAVLADRDRFPEKPKNVSEKPEHWVAWVDTDGDGQPNFFHPLATADDIDASGLTLDSDSDGDGVPDTEDTRPLYAK